MYAKLYSMSSGGKALTINHCERALRAEFLQVYWLLFEPDVEERVA